VVAATNRNLQEAIAGGTFRSDLFYRLNVFPTEIAPLQERQEDIPVLVEYFVDHCARKVRMNIQGITKESLDLLRSCPWPGNIRELQNVIERSVIVCETENFSVDETWLPRRPLASECKSQSDFSQSLLLRKKDDRGCLARKRGAGLRTFWRGHQTGHSPIYPGVQDSITEDQ
jgi:transcriptional regulator with PAS, ATPase and Fis domain